MFIKYLVGILSLKMIEMVSIWLLYFVKHCMCFDLNEVCNVEFFERKCSEIMPLLSHEFRVVGTDLERVPL